MINPILFSDVFEGNKPEEIHLSGLTNKVLVHFYVEKGPVQIRFNGQALKPLKLYQGCKWNLRFYDAELECITLEPMNKKEYKTWIIVEKI